MKMPLPRQFPRRPNRSPMSGAPDSPRDSAGGDSCRLFAVPIIAAAVLVPCLVLYTVARPVELVIRSENSANSGRETRPPDVEQIAMAAPDTVNITLESVLNQAAMEDGTVILTTMNEAWAKPGSIMDLFLESFRIGYHTRRLLDHLVIITLDQKAYMRCLSIHAHCFALSTEGVDFSGEKYFRTDDYLAMMWRRIDFLRSILERGHHFVFTDADVMWFRDPFPQFHPDADFQIACDHFFGNSSDLQNRPNGGFNYVKSNNRTIEFYKFWYKSREFHPRRHDQDVLDIIKHDPFISEIGLEMRFLDTDYFGGLCEPSSDLNKVCTMHANCCLGLDSKLHDLGIMLEDWRKFMAASPRQKASKLLTWRVPQNCRRLKNLRSMAFLFSTSFKLIVQIAKHIVELLDVAFLFVS